MICPKCGAKYPTDVDFCVKCGKVFESKIVDFYAKGDVSPYMSIYVSGRDFFYSLFYLLLPISYPILKGLYFDGINGLLILLFNTKVVPILLNASGAFAIPFQLLTILLSLIYYINNIIHYGTKIRENAYYRIQKVRRDNDKVSNEELEMLLKKDAKNKYLWFFLSFPIVIFLLIFI